MIQMMTITSAMSRLDKSRKGGRKLAKKLKNLKITSVSVVDEGANPRANIVFTKSKNPAPAAAPEVGKESEKTDNLFKRFVNWLSGEGGMTSEEVQKQATTFAQQMSAKSVEAINDEIWDVTYALRSSLSSILTDSDLDASGKNAAMKLSASQFAGAIGGYVDKWCAGQSAKFEKSDDAADLSLMNADQTHLGDMIKSKTPKGDLEEMLKIDKSKMTADELAAYEAIVKKYAIDDEAEGAKPAEEPVPEDVTKGNETGSTPETTPAPAPVESDIVKALREQIEANNAEIAKMKEDSLTKEVTEVAKKYCEPLGKKEDELVATLKKMKNAGADIYDSYNATLDQQLALQQQSGIFTEIGKSTSGTATGDAEQKWITKAKELMTKNPGMSLAKAMDQVALEDDELRAEIDQ